MSIFRLINNMEWLLSFRISRENEIAGYWTEFSAKLNVYLNSSSQKQVTLIDRVFVLVFIEFFMKKIIISRVKAINPVELMKHSSTIYILNRIILWT